MLTKAEKQLLVKAFQSIMITSMFTGRFSKLELFITPIRFHPPLIYGRRGGPEEGEGIALCRIKPNSKKGDEEHWYLLITYLLPILSAKAVPQMVKFAEIYCKSSFSDIILVGTPE